LTDAENKEKKKPEIPESKLSEQLQVSVAVSSS